MPRKGGGLLQDGVWATAYANSDGTLAGTVTNRLTYGMYILLGILGLVAIGWIVWKLFGHTFKPPPKEPFSNKKVAKRPMFRFN